MSLILTPSAMEQPVSLFTNKAFAISVLTEVPTEMVESLITACEGMCQLGFRFKVLPQGDQAWQDACLDLQTSYPDNFFIFEAVTKNKEVVLKDAHVALFTKTPKAAELRTMQKKGLVAVLPWPACESLNVLENFDAQQESGNCFLYTPEHTWDLVATMVRAFENYKFSYDWGQLKKRWKETKV